MSSQSRKLTIKGLVSFFAPSYPKTVIYMLQNTEYQPGPFLKWYWRTDDFGTVMRRRELKMTKAARMLLALLLAGMGLQFIGGLILLWLWFARETPGSWQIALSLLISYPVVWAHLLLAPLILSRVFIVTPKQRRLVRQSRRVFADHKGTKIAVAGSYGKTTFKEILGAILSEGKNVAITPANKNVPVSHAVFAGKLKGDEEVLVVEYGEGAPGDVCRFAETTRPDIGVITGIAPAHLDKYPSLDAAAQDIFSLADYLKDKNVYVNHESVGASSYIKSSHTRYDRGGVGSWKASDVQSSLDGISFKLKHGKRVFKLQSRMLGRHLIGPLGAAAVIADRLGLTKHQIEEGISKTVPFEHRLQPRQIGGAWIIDDTYNGNIDGVRAGLELLKELKAKQKIYVTPGLVDQGAETETVHNEMGRLIAKAKPDKVVLMQNSVTSYIQAGLKQAGYRGEIQTENDPLSFYTGLEHMVAAGDIWLLQNDWPDNYA